MRTPALILRAGGVAAAIAALAVAVFAQNPNPRFGKWKLKSDAGAPASNIIGGRAYCDRHFAMVNKHHMGFWRAGIIQIVLMGIFSLIVASVVLPSIPSNAWRTTVGTSSWVLLRCEIKTSTAGASPIRSNAGASTEMVDLLTLTRQFESLVRVTQGYDELLGRAIQKLGEV